ncbi:MAG TPA: L,D-transpeptidase family protein [Xanthobacteraceae bacterium]|nr:L,D-transpeptidase family protein [Xanthobacteraceae bacterium]
MRKAQKHGVLAATLALLLTSTAVYTATKVNAAPASASTPAISAKSPAATTAAVAPSNGELNARIPLPEPLNLPPPTAKDAVSAPVPDKSKDTTAPASEQPKDAAAPAQDKSKDAAAPATAPAPAAATIPAAADKEVASKPPVVVPGDPVAEKLHDLITTKLAKYIERKDERAGVDAFYAARQFAPLWTDKGVANDKEKAAADYLAHVDADGLYPSDYPVPNFSGSDPQALAEAELKLTRSVLTFARHAQNGRVAFSRVTADVFYEQSDPDAKQVLEAIAKAGDAAKALDANLPQQAQYKALKVKLAELRSQPPEAVPKIVRIPEGDLLRPGMNDSRVPLLRKRLDVASDSSDNKYDDKTVEAVKKFQDGAGLEVDGVIGPETLRNLNGDAHGRTNTVDTILANMERWRWMPHSLGNTYVMLNIPDFMLKVVKDGEVVWRTKVVVGKPDKPTPILSASMKYITVNPTWNVPPSIVYQEYLPLLYQDPSALDRYGLKVTQDENGGVHMYQPPGDANALGRIRFNFPNKFLVYQHDTPEKYLFDKVSRAYSHGCMRVQDPLKYAEVLLSIAAPKEGYTQDRLRAMYGNEEKEIQFKTFIPVHITYQTAYVDDSGKLVIRPDVYGRDAQTIAVLKGDRQVADVPMDRKAEMQANYDRPPVQLPYGVSTDDAGYSRYSVSDGSSFFEMLFGGGRGYYARPPAYVRSHGR